ncbi:dihydrofolate reductase [Phormidium sp. CLA17]|uniref:dihydrofolate reductase family protein n=1 Tax=Leptolyngbya sp. Cla-17 TaxID=2803751 RepID=UPI0018D8DBE4|nr:dihydrofolate reductase family protein [Leptolyngbya sp. Cla-17]MBM0742638.1 dihydrofolate reductase [Leptolyngbya sp. Cla-17]
MTKFAFPKVIQEGYIATSLDGYIARRNGSVDWLPSEDTGEDFGYAAFYQSVDVLAMGRTTYEQVLSFGEWPYPSKPSYVFTQQALISDRPDVFFTSVPPDHFVQEMTSQGFHRIWLVGGAALVAAFLKLGLIDQYILSVMPVILGDGIPLFSSPHPETALKLVKVQQYHSIGAVQITYQNKRATSTEVTPNKN